MDIVQLKGEDKQLYSLVAHLVMDEEVNRLHNCGISPNLKKMGLRLFLIGKGM